MKIDFSIYTKHAKTDNLPNKDSIIALGTFDGLHFAHQKLIEEAKNFRLKNSPNALVGAWCFSDNPAQLLSGKNIPSITSTEEKIELLFSLGVDFVAVGSFADFKDVSAEDFINDFLISKLSCIGTVCGYNHRFGVGGSGNHALLESVFGNNAICVPEIKINGETVSSTAIRNKLADGDVKGAAAMLGRNYSICGEVVRGKQLGRKIGFPTANQFFRDGAVVLKFGIYAVKCKSEDGKTYIGTANVGIRPSINDLRDSHKVNCETYIHNFSEDLYGKKLTVEFCDFIRPETKFDSIQKLKEAISSDIEITSNLLKK